MRQLTMRRPLFVLVLLLAVCGLAWLAGPVTAGRPAQLPALAWTVEVLLDPGPVVGFDFVLDAADRPRLVYGAADGELRYRWHDGGDWQEEPVVSGDALGVIGDPVLVLDDAGQPHVAYRHMEAGMQYARRAADGTWSVETITADASRQADTAIALGPDGRPHVSYFFHTPERETGLVAYAVRGEDGWETDAIDITGAYNGDPSLAVDADGQPHVAYYHYLEAAARYAVKVGGAWQRETIDEEAWYASLQLDSDGLPHISHYARQPDDLKYVHVLLREWWVETVDAPGDTGLYTSLELDANDRPHIAYQDRDNGVLRYARGTDEAWDIAAVDEDGRVGEDAVLELDSAGNAHIMYLELAGRRDLALRYAVSREVPASPTPPATATATPTATPPATAVPAPAYLPLVQRLYIRPDMTAARADRIGPAPRPDVDPPSRVGRSVPAGAPEAD